MTEAKQGVKLSNNAMIQEEDTTWMGSNYMAMAGISYVEMLEEAADLGFMACTVPVAKGVPVYSNELNALLQTMGFIAME